MQKKTKSKVVIVMPAYNEEKTIGPIINVASQFGKVIVVDDCSKDKTSQIARSFGATVITHKKNAGLGASLIDGFSKALEMKADIIITIDADGQHDPKEIPKFISKIEDGYDFVLGNRDLCKYPLRKRFGNFFLTAATNIICSTSLADTESGFRAFTYEALKKLQLSAQRYEIAAEIVYEVGRNKIKASNVKIISPLYKKGVSVMDGLNNFLYLVKK